MSARDIEAVYEYEHGPTRDGCAYCAYLLARIVKIKAHAERWRDRLPRPAKHLDKRAAKLQRAHDKAHPEKSK